MSRETATIETLTAEVRVLMVGSRQVTLSVYRQLDIVDRGEIDPFGRVRDSKNPDPSSDPLPSEVWVVGRRKSDGALVKAVAWEERMTKDLDDESWEAAVDMNWLHRQWSDLPLVVLAGLR